MDRGTRLPAQDKHCANEEAPLLRCVAAAALHGDPLRDHRQRSCTRRLRKIVRPSLADEDTIVVSSHSRMTVGSADIAVDVAISQASRASSSDLPAYEDQRATAQANCKKNARRCGAVYIPWTLSTAHQWGSKWYDLRRWGGLENMTRSIRGQPSMHLVVGAAQFEDAIDNDNLPFSLLPWASSAF